MPIIARKISCQYQNIAKFCGLSKTPERILLMGWGLPGLSERQKQSVFNAAYIIAQFHGFINNNTDLFGRGMNETFPRKAILAKIHQQTYLEIC
jgi:hypothetical protein